MLFPQLAQQSEVTSLEMFLTNDNWVGEQKLDGHRNLFCSGGGDFPPSALTRNGTPYSRGLPQDLRNFRFPGDIAPHTWVIDGELVGKEFWAFDMPVSPLTSPDSSLLRRRTMLEEFIKVAGGPIRLIPQAKTTAEKIQLAEVALRQNFEGLIFKQANSRYASGARNSDWIKVKFVSTTDCIVLAVRDDNKDSVKLGLRSGDSIVEVGRASLIGKEKGGDIAPGDVIEVRYLYVGAQGRLYQPTILRKRHDKRPDECDVSQLKYVNKSVLATL
jgi:ATP-dependent DNA ligase